MANKAVNNKDSQNDVIKSMTHVMEVFENLVRCEMPGTSVIYDEELSYETGIKQLLANDDFSNSNRDPLPLFIYNRTILRDTEHGLASRAKNLVGCQKVNNQQILYSAAYGEFDIQFLYVTKNMQMSEAFEVVYNSNEGITGSRELTLGMGDLGDFKYFLTYDELTDKPIEHENVTYKGVIGSLRVRGFYFTFRGEAGLIQEINTNIYASRELNEKTELIASSQILPP
jgi:hypothetical protein